MAAYVTFTDQELKALDEAVTQGIEIAEFVPKDAVDPVYFDRSCYLGPGKGGDKPYALLAQAMDRMGLMAVARHAARGKDYLVVLRTAEDRILMHQLHHSDEVRPVSEVPAAGRSVNEPELKLARQLIDQIASDRFDPARYEDQVRKRVKKAIAEKAKGGAITPTAERKPKAEVIDLMAALKASLGKKKSAAQPKARGRETKSRRTA